MGFSPISNDGPQAEINVVPLVDIMLVLLVIFMVTAPILQQGVDVNLPKATTAPLAGNSEQLVLSIDKSGKVFLGAGNEIPVGEIGPKVAAILRTKDESNQKVYIKGDETISYGQMMTLMSELHQSGITQIGLVSAPHDRK